MNDRTNAPARSFPWLAIGAVLMIFSNGRWIVPITTWLAPVFILRFVRTQKPSLGLPLSLLVSILAYTLSWRGLIPLPGVFFYLVAGGLGLAFWLPYLCDCLLAPRTRGFVGTLVFPLAWTTLEYVYTETNPFASWGSLAYTQYGNLPLLQVASVTGIWGVTFLVTWFASVVNWMWASGFAWPRIRRGFTLYAGIFASVLLLGGLRLAVFCPHEDTVRIDSLVSTPQTSGLPDSAVLDNYLERTRYQARAGARIVLWDEGAVCVSQQDEPLFTNRGCELARQEGIHLLMALAVTNVEGRRGHPMNKVVWINPSGDIAFEYTKHLVLPGESPGSADTGLGTDDTPYGRIAAAICMDLDRPSYIRQSRKSRPDILLAPSFDWKEIDPIHTHMASFRALENGFSVVRGTCEGLSAAFDCCGRVLSATDYFATDAAPMVCHVPTKGVKTVYSVVGDVFAWLCAMGLLVIVGWVVSAPLRRARGSGVSGHE